MALTHMLRASVELETLRRQLDQARKAHQDIIARCDAIRSQLFTVQDEAKASRKHITMISQRIKALEDAK